MKRGKLDTSPLAITTRATSFTIENREEQHDQPIRNKEKAEVESFRKRQVKIMRWLKLTLAVFKDKKM
jgi:hypothetical protein